MGLGGLSGFIFMGILSGKMKDLLSFEGSIHEVTASAS